MLMVETDAPGNAKGSRNVLPEDVILATAGKQNHMDAEPESLDKSQDPAPAAAGEAAAAGFIGSRRSTGPGFRGPGSGRCCRGQTPA